MSGNAQRSMLFADSADQRQASELIDAAGGVVSRLVEQSGDEPFEVPPSLMRILRQVVNAVANGGTVVISSMPEEVTTTVAADQLGVSRPTLMKMIKNGEIRSHMTGSHHRLKTSDVQEAKRLRLQKQREAFEELRRLEDELAGY